MIEYLSIFIRYTCESHLWLSLKRISLFSKACVMFESYASRIISLLPILFSFFSTEILITWRNSRREKLIDLTNTHWHFCLVHIQSHDFLCSLVEVFPLWYLVYLLSSTWILISQLVLLIWYEFVCYCIISVYALYYFYQIQSIMI